MFGTQQDKLLKALENIRIEKCCVYTPGMTFCDCKFGADKRVRFGTENENGCPELRQAISIIKALTKKEWRLMNLRAGNRIWEEE